MCMYACLARAGLAGKDNDLKVAGAGIEIAAGPLCDGEQVYWQVAH